MSNSKSRIVALVQARLGSSRLPLKSLLCLRGRPVIDWVTDRLKRARKIDEIIVAVPDTRLDQVLVDHLRSRGITCVCGPEDDVLKRMLMAANSSPADYLVRVCADNPLVSPEAVDELVRFHLKNGPDYSYNHIPRGNLWPDGLGAEIISRALLVRLDELANKPSQREHCLNYIWDNAAKFDIATFDPAPDWLKRPDLKFDIDSAEDFIKLSSLPLRPEMTDRELLEACPAPR